MPEEAEYPHILAAAFLEYAITAGSVIATAECRFVGWFPGRVLAPPPVEIRSTAATSKRA